MSRIKEDLNRLMPLRAIGRNGQSVTVGNRFNLSLGGYFENTVAVVEATDTSFTLRAIPGQHSLQGTVTVQVFTDSSGELWLEFLGKGVALEHPVLQERAYEAAAVIWPEFADRLRYILSH